MKSNDIFQKLEDADLILVGIGEDFDDIKRLKNMDSYNRGKAFLQEIEAFSFLPAWNEFCSAKLASNIPKALDKLNKILNEKNYFVVSTATNTKIREIDWNNRLVMPCGSSINIQIMKDGEDCICELKKEDRIEMYRIFEKLYVDTKTDKPLSIDEISWIKNITFNNVYAANYNESSYITQWQNYTKWLQGTVNKKLVILELGVGMKYPSVIRWPFEKVAFYNQKASFFRVHESLYQLAEGMGDKGIGIAENAIEWLQKL